MKIRLTPLNIATAFFLVMAGYTWIYGAGISGPQYKHLGTAIGWVFLLFALVVAFMDVMLRNFFKELKTLWLVELSFITLTAVIFLLVK
jgi:hypothetical protein